MNRKMLSITLLVILIVLLGLGAFSEKARGAKKYQTLSEDTFTYQGQLIRNGKVVDGKCDFRLSLWTDSSNGSQVGENRNINGISIRGGYFTIPSLYFGDDAFTGEARWLEIETKCEGDTVFTKLSPRQMISPAPYALALPGFYTQQNETSPNVVGGYTGNIITEGVFGAAISGGGSVAGVNQVTDHYGTISGGLNNRIGNQDDMPDNAAYGTIGGGVNNIADAGYATVGGGFQNTAGNSYAAVSGGNNNLASGGNAFVGSGEANTAAGDYSAIGGGKNNDAQGQAAVIGGGEINTVSGDFASVSGGYNNIAMGDYSSIPGGNMAESSLYGQMAYASGAFSESGDAQYSIYILRNVTTNAAATELFLDGTSQRLMISPNHTLVFEVIVAARHESQVRSAGYYIRGVIRNYEGATAFVSSPNMAVWGEDDTAWNVTLTASDSYDALIIQATGAENAVIRWVAAVRAVDVAW